MLRERLFARRTGGLALARRGGETAALSTIAAALGRARQSIDARDASVLLCHLLGCNTAFLAAHRDDDVDATKMREYVALVERRRAGEPIAYLTGEREFYGRLFHVGPGVLIPRPETELIIDIVRQKFAREAGIRILDLGTGSGCLAVTLALQFPHAEVTAVDVSMQAIEIARGNARALDAAINFRESDWFAALADERFDLIVSNPPYIAQHDPHLGQGDLRFEPMGALAAGPDGLEAIRRIARDALLHLTSGGWLVFEHGYDQAAAARALLTENGYWSVEQFCDIAGIVRVSAGRRGEPVGKQSADL